MVICARIEMQNIVYKYFGFYSRNLVKKRRSRRWIGHGGLRTTTCYNFILVSTPHKIRWERTLSVVEVPIISSLLEYVRCRIGWKRFKYHIITKDGHFQYLNKILTPLNFHYIHDYTVLIYRYRGTFANFYFKQLPLSIL